jgi:glycosyltransferase involved in cell wall biosynthesis
MAAALAESLATHHFDSKFTVFVLDNGSIPASLSNLRICPIEEAVPRPEFTKRRCYYDLLELATSVKARCFQKLFSDGDDIVIYLDPDIYLFRSLLEIEKVIQAGASGILIPHILGPLPDDDRHPTDLDILRSGVYNLGFLALAAGAETNRFLDWWDNKLKWHCLRDPKEGVFTDQRWMDFAPVFLPRLKILRDPTYNVAYWNLSGRTLDLPEGRDWTVNGAPLSFFHYSGFDPDRPHDLSAHQDRFDKVDGSIAAMLSFYASRLDAHHHDELAQIKFSAPKFEIGAAWDPICRVLYRWKIRSGEREFDPLESPSFLSWMASSGPGQTIPRYVLALLQMRPDVLSAYPDPAGRDWDAIVKWLSTSGVAEFGIDRALLIALGILPAEKMPVQKVTYVGYFRSHLGVGEAARGYFEALTQQVTPLSLLDISKESSNPVGDYQAVADYGIAGGTRRADVALIHVNADELPRILALNASSIQASQKIGIWAWETSDFPDRWLDRFELLDEVWVPSQFVAKAIGVKAPCPVIVIPHVIKVPSPQLGRTAFGLSEDEFVFLMQFDFNSVAFRKNPEGAIRAFKMAFPDSEPVKLLVKTINGDCQPSRMKRLRELADDPRIVFFDETFDDQRRYDLLAAADCYVSLHRAEGFGLSMAESMAYGKPVVATGWSGNMEFMDVSNSCLISFRLEALANERHPYPAGTIWAEPDLDVAAAALRRLFFDRAWAAAIGAQAKKDIADKLSPGVIGQLMKTRLQTRARIQMRTTDPHASTTPDSRPFAQVRYLLRQPRKALRNIMMPPS